MNKNDLKAKSEIVQQFKNIDNYVSFYQLNI